MKIPLQRVAWSQNISAGNDHGKSLSSNERRRLFCTSIGVLIEQEGKPDEMVPMAQVAVMVPDGGKWMTSGAVPFEQIRRGPGRPPKVQP